MKQTAVFIGALIFGTIGFASPKLKDIIKAECTIDIFTTENLPVSLYNDYYTSSNMHPLAMKCKGLKTSNNYLKVFRGDPTRFSELGGTTQILELLLTNPNAVAQTPGTAAVYVLARDKGEYIHLQDTGVSLNSDFDDVPMENATKYLDSLGLVRVPDVAINLTGPNVPSWETREYRKLYLDGQVLVSIQDIGPFFAKFKGNKTFDGEKVVIKITVLEELLGPAGFVLPAEVSKTIYAIYSPQDSQKSVTMAFTKSQVMNPDFNPTITCKNINKCLIMPPKK